MQDNEEQHDAGTLTATGFNHSGHTDSTQSYNSKEPTSSVKSEREATAMTSRSKVNGGDQTPVTMETVINGLGQCPAVISRNIHRQENLLPAPGGIENFISPPRKKGHVSATADHQSQQDRLPECPAPGHGVNNWILSAAWSAKRAGCSTNEANALIHARISRTPKSGEIEKAVSKAYDSVPQGSYPPPIKESFSLDTMTRVAQALDGFGKVELHERSPINPKSCTPAKFLMHLFKPGERVFLCSGMTDTEGVIWERDRDDASHDPLALDALIYPQEGQGAWFQCNPVIGEWQSLERLISANNPNGMTLRSEECLTDYRYLVLESDEAPTELWIQILAQLPLPIVSITTSGGRSIHALIRLDATNARDWQDIKQAIAPALVTLGADKGALSLVRLTRLPCCFRESNNQWQELLYLNPRADETPINKLPVLPEAERISNAGKAIQGPAHSRVNLQSFEDFARVNKLPTGQTKVSRIEFETDEQATIERPKTGHSVRSEKSELAVIQQIEPTNRSAKRSSNILVPSVTASLHADYGIVYNGNRPVANLAAITRVLRKHPEWAGKIYYDTFLGRVLTGLSTQSPPEWTDQHDNQALIWLQETFELHNANIDDVRRAAAVVAHANPTNCLQEWLSSLKWDNQSRLSNLLSTGFGTEVSEYHSRVGECWLISMVARGMKPGCKVDTLPVFEGEQGTGKSSGLGILGGELFTECHEQITSKDFYSVLAGRWLVEISEMHSFSKAEVERIKGIISNQKDRYRLPYDKHASDHPRQCVFAGTTNRDDWHNDDTGGRRFWPVACGEVNLQWLKENRDQLFAEAVVRYQNGESWWDVPTDDHRQKIDARRQEDPWTSAVLTYMEDNAPCSMTDILRYGVEKPTETQTSGDQRRCGAILRQHCYENFFDNSDGKKRKWRKKVAR